MHIIPQHNFDSLTQMTGSDIEKALQAAQEARDFVRNGEFENASALIQKHLYASGFYKAQGTFDAALETVFENLSDPLAIQKSLQFCELLESVNLSSPYITVIHPACLLALRRFDDAAQYLAWNGYSLKTTNDLIFVYQSLGKPHLVKLLENLNQFMNNPRLFESKNSEPTKLS